MARDMTVFQDDDGTAYHFYSSEENATMHVSRLTDDYLKPSGEYARIFIGRSMEAAGGVQTRRKILYHRVRFAWDGTQSRPFGGYRSSVHFQTNSAILRGEDARSLLSATAPSSSPCKASRTYIFMADRWKQWNLADSRYLWLPLRFGDDGKPVVEWRKEWRP